MKKTGEAFVGKREDDQGCQIFLVQNTKNGRKYIKLPLNIPNGNKIYHMAVK
jgi:hypothetical protein